MNSGTFTKPKSKTLKEANITDPDPDPDTLHSGETSTPVMEIFKVKTNSDGSLDKLKNRIVVRGDLQSKNITEDKWSPTASFRSVKMFLAHAAELKVRVGLYQRFSAGKNAKSNVCNNSTNLWNSLS